MPKVKSPLKVRLEQWYLKRVPFPAVPFVDPFSADPLRNGSVFVAAFREEEIKRLRDDILSAGFADTVKPWRWVWARKQMGIGVGLGKTALFTYAVHQINHDYGKRFFGYAAHWLAVYVPVQPKTKSTDELLALALAGVCKDIRGMSVERLVLARLRHKVVALGKYGPHSLNLGAVTHKTLANDHWLIEHGINLDALAAAVERYLCEQGVAPDVAKAVATNSLERYFAALDGASDLIPPKPKLVGKAPSLLLNEFARITLAAGISHITFLLDDFYHLVRKTPPGERTSLAANLRNIAVEGPYFSISRNLFNWVAVMHTLTAPTFSEAWRERQMDLVDSLHFVPSAFALRPLTSSNGPELLETYLSFQRPSAVPSKIFPYTPEGLQAITRFTIEQNKVSDGDKYEPRILLQRAFDVTLEALHWHTDPAPIGQEFVEHVLMGKPFAQIPDTDDVVMPAEASLPITQVCSCPCHQDEDEEVRDMVAMLAGGNEQDFGKIIGYRCMACNTPLSLAS